MDIPTRNKVIRGFCDLAFSRSQVRLEFALYSDRASYLKDKNKIRRHTKMLKDEVGRLLRQFQEKAVAEALIEISKYERFRYYEGQWEYITGQYTPVEIRYNAYKVCNLAYSKLLTKFLSTL